MDLSGSCQMVVRGKRTDNLCSIREGRFSGVARRKFFQTSNFSNFKSNDKPEGDSFFVGEILACKKMTITRATNELDSSSPLRSSSSANKRDKQEGVLLEEEGGGKQLSSARMGRLKVKIGPRGAPGIVMPITCMIISSATLLILLLAASNTPAEAVDCFKCSSRNGSNPACEDPFHNMNTTRIISPVLPDPPPGVIYHAPCYAGKKGREGLFPASACIKLTGTFARMSHCGKFQFEGDLLKGCVLACPEDACNGSVRRAASGSIFLLFIIIITCFLLTGRPTINSAG